MDRNRNEFKSLFIFSWGTFRQDAQLAVSAASTTKREGKTPPHLWQVHRESFSVVRYYSIKALTSNN